MQQRVMNVTFTPAALGTAADGSQGDNYEVVYRAAVDYGEWKAFIYEDFDSGGQDEYADHGAIPAILLSIE